VTTWGLGEYSLMAERLEPAAIAAVDAADVQSGDRVVDVATGTGNAALVAAKRGADVVGVDFEPTLLTLAEHRSAGLELRVRWETADATAVPVPDSWADVVLSVFGVMYAGDQEAAARELARCAAPGARIVLASWVPGSFMPTMGSALNTFLPPPPPSSGPPSRWGDPNALEGLVAPYALGLVSHSTESLALTFGSTGEAVNFLVRTAGHVVAEQESLTAQGRWGDLLVSLEELIEARGRRVESQVRIDLDYLLATITPR
jgi:SAM-dependent methyltransferase